MTARVTAPGAYDGVPAEAYHGGDLTPEPALSSSGARDLVNECPAYYWHRSALNPRREPEEKRAFDIGSAAHLLTLEPHLFAERVHAIACDDYRTKEAREQRDLARANGRVPLLTKEVDDVVGMRDAIMAHPVASLAFREGVAERTYVWRCPETGIWCKARPDYTPAHLRYFVDIKTSTSANPHAFAKRVAELGYHQQAAWYLDARHAVDGIRPERFAFVVVAKTRPHLVSVCWLDDETIAWGDALNRKAKRLFAECLRSGEWPGYRDAEMEDRDAAFTISLPGWKRNELERRHERGEFVLERALANDSNPFA